MSAKHFSNDPSALVNAGLSSLTHTNPSVALDEAQKTVYLKSAVQPGRSTVAVISGGGSGHEPSFGGFVGAGFLSAAVAGSIFASPSAEQVYRCLMRLGAKNPDSGILVAIMNYTGDKLHFGIAVEKARAAGVRAEMLVVADDVGVGRARSGRIGRRGLAGTVLVQKVASALATQGRPLEEVIKTASLAAENVATVGASLAHVHVPGREAPTDELTSNDEVEIGMGIHNEEGFGRVKDTLQGVVSVMLTQLLDTTDKDRGFISIGAGEEVLVMINNLGGLSQLELGAVATEALSQLTGTYKLVPRRVLAGTYMSSLNGSGFSITLLKLVDPSFLGLIDTPADASGWHPPTNAANFDLAATQPGSAPEQDDSAAQHAEPPTTSNLRIDPSAAVKTLTSGLQSLITAEPAVTKYDTLVGDGDCGLCLKTGAEAVLSHIGDPRNQTGDAVALTSSIARVVERSMDGTSGALYAIFLNALAYGLRTQQDVVIGGGGKPVNADAAVWASALASALRSLGTYTPAQPGDRTVVDALQPFVATFAETGDLARAVGVAREGCGSTRGMEASLGRSVYVGGDEWRNCPDPGAFGLVAFLEGLLK